MRRAALFFKCNHILIQRNASRITARYSQAPVQHERHHVHPAIRSTDTRLRANDSDQDMNSDSQLGVNHRVDGDFEPADPSPRPPPEDKEKGKRKTEEISDREWDIRTGEISALISINYGC